MAGYAAAMDASMMEGSSSGQDATAAEAATGGLLEKSESQEGEGGVDVPPEDWERRTADLSHTSLSTCASEVDSRKSRGERSQWVGTGSQIRFFGHV